MSHKEFILIIIALLVVSGGYYLHSNQLWPFDGQMESSRVATAGDIYSVWGHVSEVHDSIIVLNVMSPEVQNQFETVMIVIDTKTDMFTHSENSSRISISPGDISIGDKLIAVSNNDITKSENGSFLASSMMLYR